METFKIIVIIFLILLTYQIYQLNCTVYKEGFEGTPQSVGGVDDVNAINTLAQIAKNLMTGGLTVPGAMNISGNTNVTGDTKVTGALGVGTNLNVTGNTTLGGTLTTAVDKWNTSADGKNRTYYEDNKASIYGSATGVHFFRTGANGAGPDGIVIDQNSNLSVKGGLTAKNRNVLGEIDQIKASINTIKSIMGDQLKNTLIGAALFSQGNPLWGVHYPKYEAAINTI